MFDSIHSDLFEDASHARRREWESLSHERDPEMRSEGLLLLAGRAEQNGERELARRIYAHLGEDRYIGARARERLAAILGQGGAGAFEARVREFAHHAVDPALLAGLTAASSVYRLTRLASLSTCVEAPVLRLLGNRATASLLAYSAEALSFPLATRLANLGLGRAQNWSRETIGTEIASSFLMLGALRAAGAIGRELLPQGTMAALLRPGLDLSALMLAQGAEIALQLRPSESFSNLLAASLTSLLQFHVASRVARGILGPRFAQWEQGLEQHARYLEARHLARPRLWMDPPWPGALASAHIVAASPRPETSPKPEPIISMSEGSGFRAGARPKSDVRQVISPREDFRPRRLGSHLRLMRVQGVYWLVDTQSDGPARTEEVRVDSEILAPRGSLRVRDGQTITIGEASFTFVDPAEGSTEPAATPESVRVVQRGYHGSPNFSIHLGNFLDHWAINETRLIASSEGGDYHLHLRGGRMMGPSPDPERMRAPFEYELELQTPRENALFRLQWREGEIEITAHEMHHIPPFASQVFLEWLARQTATRALGLRIRTLPPALLRFFQCGLVQEPYSWVQFWKLDPKERRIDLERLSLDDALQRAAKLDAREGMDLIAQPEITMVPPVHGRLFQEAAARAFDLWMHTKLGIRLPSMTEIDAGHPLPELRHLRVKHEMDSILGKLVGRRSRFLEIGYGERTETLEAVARHGGIPLGLEQNQTYPAGENRAHIEQGPVDVLFINGSPFIFYANHQVTLPAALDILRHFQRTRWVVIQSYNPRTPFEMIRHAEWIHHLDFEIMYYRATPSRLSPPPFPTDHGDRPETHNAVLIARRRS